VCSDSSCHILTQIARYTLHGPGKHQSRLYLIQIESICFPGYNTKIPNHNTQIPNNIKIPKTNDLNYFDFSSIDENIFFNSFASCIKFWASLAFLKSFVS